MKERGGRSLRLLPFIVAVAAVDALLIVVPGKAEAETSRADTGG